MLPQKQAKHLCLDLMHKNNNILTIARSSRYVCSIANQWYDEGITTSVKHTSQCQPRLFYGQPSQRNGQVSADQGFSTTSQGSCYVCARYPLLKPAHLPLSHFFCERKTNLQNGLRQLIHVTCGQSCMMSTLVISG